MAKEICMMFLDLGDKMFEKYDDDRKNIDIANLSLKEIFKHKLLYNRKNHEIGIYLTGNYENNSVMPIQKINLNMVRYLNNVFNVIKEPENTNSFFSDLIKTVELIKKKAGKSKGKKKIFIFTTADFNSDMNDIEIDEVIWLMRGENILVNIISFGFWGIDNSKLTENQINNKQLFKKMIKNPNFKIFSSSLTLLIHRQFKKKEISIKPSYSGNLQICPNINLQIKIYSKTKVEKMKLMKKYNKNLDYDVGDKTNLVKNETVFYEENDINKSDLIKGYTYGDQVIPIPKDLDNLMKFKDIKGLSLLAFVKESDIPRHYYLSEAEVIYPDGDEDNILAFNSIVRACLENLKLGIAKFVKRENDNPKLVVLHPYYKKKNFCFYLLELPTIEDIRDYQFRSLKKCDDEKRKSIRNFITKMDLMNVKKDKEIIEELNPTKIYNPTIQYFNQCIIHKIENENKDKIKDEIENNLPEIKEEYINQYKINEILLNDCEEEIIDLKNKLNLKKNEEYLEKKRERIYWKNLLEEYEDNNNNLQNELITNKLDRDDKNYIKIIDINHPLSDFKDMMNNRNEDLVDSAISQMIIIIRKLIIDSLNKSNFDKAIECLKYLKDSCIFEEEYINFNNFLKEVKDNKSGNFKLFFKELILRKISLISNEEVNLSDITNKESQIYLNINIEELEIIEEIKDNDEIFDEID